MSTLTPEEEALLKRHKGHGCGTTTSVAETLEFGYGDLDFNGFWEIPCTKKEGEVAQ